MIVITISVLHSSRTFELKINRNFLAQGIVGMIILKHIFFRKRHFVRHIQGVRVVTTIFFVKYREKILSMVQNELHIHENIFPANAKMHVHSAVLLSFFFF